MKNLWLIMALLMLGVPAFAQNFIVTEAEYVVISGNLSDTLGRTRLTPDSIRIVVTDSAQTELFDAWFNDADVQCTLNGDIIAFSDQWEDINGGADIGVFSITAIIAGTQNSIEVFSEYNYTLRGVTVGVNQTFNVVAYIGEHGFGIFVDSTAGNTNTVLGTDGTEKNPVSTLAAARTLALALGSHRFYIHGGSTFNGASVDLGADYSEWEFYGEGHGIELAFGGQLVTNSYFHNITLSGAMHASGGDVLFEDCEFGYVSANFNGEAKNCILTDTLVLKADRDIKLLDCYSGVTGEHTPTIDFSGGSSLIDIRGPYSGGMRFMNGSANDTISIESIGQIIVSANNTSLTISARGIGLFTDSGTTTSSNMDSYLSGAYIADVNWDELVAGHSIALSFGDTIPKVLSALHDTFIYQGGVWVDAGANTNTVVGVDGTPKNPVGTIAAAKTIADALGFATIFFLDGANETIGATMEHYRFTGITRNATVNLGSQDVDGSFFEHLMLTGEQGGTGSISVINSGLSILDSLQIHARNCAILGPISLRGGDKTNYFDKCYSSVAGSDTPILNFNDATDSIYVNWRAYSGGLELQNMTTNHVMSYEADGQLVINANSDNGIVVARGNMTITNNGTSMNIDDDAVFSRQEYSSWAHANVDTSYVDSSLYGEWLVNNLSGAGGSDTANIILAILRLAASDTVAASLWADLVRMSDSIDNGVNVASIQNDVIDAGVIATNAIGAAEMAANTIGSDEFTSSAATKIWNVSFGSSFTGGSMGDSLNNASYVQGSASGLTAAEIADTFDIRGDVSVNMAQISGDATAADNFKTMLDGTGGNELSLGALHILATGGDTAMFIVGNSSIVPSLLIDAGSIGGGAMIRSSSGDAFTVVTNGGDALVLSSLSGKDLNGVFDTFNFTEEFFDSTQGAAGSLDTTDIKTMMLNNPTIAGGESDMTRISSDATAADNLETMLDSTGGKPLTVSQLVIESSANNSAIYAKAAGTGRGAQFVSGSGGGSAVLMDGSTGTGHALRLIANTGDGLSILSVSGADIGAKLIAANFATDAIDANAIATDAVDEISEKTWFNIDTNNVDSSKIGEWLVNNLVGAAGSLDSTALSNILHRIVWGTSKAAGTDSSTTAERDVGLATTVTDGAKSTALANVQDTATAIRDTVVSLSTTLSARYNSLLQFLGWGEIAGDAIWSQDKPNTNADTLWVGISNGTGTVDTVAYQVIFHVGGAASDAPDSTKSYLWP